MNDEEERWADLPPKTRKFVKDLREEDIALLHDGIKLLLALRTVGKFTKWVIFGMIAAFITFVSLAEAIAKALSMLRGAGR